VYVCRRFQFNNGTYAMTDSTRSSRLVTWKDAWASPAMRRQFLLTLPALVVVMLIFSRFILYIENRPAVTIPDPVLALFEARDFTWLVFTFIYGGVVLGIFYLLSHPRALLVALQAYVIMMSIRMIVMYLAPLGPPEGLIPLVDPFATAGTGVTLTKDLFFSGHTSTIFLLFLTARIRTLRLVFLICAIITGGLLMLQHVHYSLDVAAAPFFAYASYRAALRFEAWYAGRWSRRVAASSAEEGRNV
jgi:hypothetical protein